jgi:hypothetical protein
MDVETFGAATPGTDYAPRRVWYDGLRGVIVFDTQKRVADVLLPTY